MRHQAILQQLDRMAILFETASPASSTALTPATSLTSAKQLRHQNTRTIMEKCRQIAELLDSGEFGKACNLYSANLPLSRTAYTSLISGHLERYQLDSACRVYHHMRFTGLRPTLYTYSQLISLHCNNLPNSTIDTKPHHIQSGSSNTKLMETAILMARTAPTSPLQTAMKIYRDLRMDGMRPNGSILKPLVFSHLRTGQWMPALELSGEWQRYDPDGWMDSADRLLWEILQSDEAPADGILMVYHALQSGLKASAVLSGSSATENALSDECWNALLKRLLFRERMPSQAWQVLQQMRYHRVPLRLLWKCGDK